MKVTPEPYDVDCLYLLTLEMLRLGAQYDARASGHGFDRKPRLQVADISADEAKVVLRAFSQAISVHPSYADVYLKLCLNETEKCADLARWVEPITAMHRDAFLAHPVNLEVWVNERNPPGWRGHPGDIDLVAACIWESVDRVRNY